MLPKVIAQRPILAKQICPVTRAWGKPKRYAGSPLESMSDRANFGFPQ
jgi:hypothetical protein